MVCSTAALAQGAWHPERAAEIIVNTAAGSGPDRTARALQKILQEGRLVDVALAVSNRAGGGGAIAYNFLNQKGGDGHFIAIASASLITNNVMGRGPGHADITPIARLTGEYIAVAVRADSPLRSGRDLIDRLKKDPGALSFGVATSLGNSNHQAVALALKASGLDLRKARNVVFQSGGNAITALLGGHVDVVPASVSSWIGRLEAGESRLIAVAAPQRLTGVVAEVPTWNEQGVSAVVSNWRSVVGPRGMTAPQASYWIEALRKAVATAEWKRELERGHLTDEFLPGREFHKYLDEQHAQIRALLVDLELLK
jgi:putative tricarboxylic transport membrane protein